MNHTVIKKNQLRQRILKHKNIYLIILPALLYYIVFAYIPMFGNVIAFQDYSVARGILKSGFVGIENFKDFLSNYKFWSLLRNTVSINLYGLAFSFPAPIILALLLNEVGNLRFKKAVQTITYMPHFISTVIISSMVLTFVSDKGLVNVIRAGIGLEKMAFMTKSSYFYAIYTISGIWQGIGWGSIIYIAALAGIDQELYEAAMVDGAGRLRKLIHITIPGIMPTIIILFIMNVGQMLSVGYEKVMLLYNPSIYDKADVISTYVYREGLLNMNYSYSTAVGIFNSVVNFILLMSVNKISKTLTDTALW